METISHSELHASQSARSWSPSLEVAGTYRLNVYEGEGSTRVLKELPIVVKITHRPDYIGVNIYDEKTEKSNQLDYLMNGAPHWDPVSNVTKFTRVVNGKFTVDFVTPTQATEAPSEIMTRRITWNLDPQGSIHEYHEDFDSSGKRLDRSKGFYQVLTRLIES